MKIQVRKDKDRRLQDVKEAAERLFEKYGYDQVSTKMIAKEAGISRTLVYRYHGSKLEILSHILIDMLSEQARVLDDHATTLRPKKNSGSKPVDLIVNYFVKLYELDTHPSAIKIRQLAAQQGWVWEPEIEVMMYMKAGDLFWPLCDLLDQNSGPKLHEGARHAIWAIYTETLRHQMVQAVRTDTPNLEAWKETFQGQIELLINGLISPPIRK